MKTKITLSVLLATYLVSATILVLDNNNNAKKCQLNNGNYLYMKCYNKGQK